MTTPDLILAADFGTSGVKIGAVGPDLALVATVTETYPLHLPAPARAEQMPEDWWAALARGIARLGAEVPHLAARTGALVFTAQMCGVICADAEGHALRPALVWLDKRSAPVIRRKTGGFPRIAGYGAGFLARSIRLANGAPSHNGMDPPGKMLWIMEEEPEVFARTAHFLDVKDWLIQRATGEATTTADSANLTWLMDTRRGREGWSPALAARYGLPLDRLPAIVDGAAEVGPLTPAAASQLELRPGTPVLGGGGDVSATAIGSGAVADGALHVCLSTSSWVAGFFDRRVLNVFAAYATITASIDRRPLLIATQEVAGSALSWLAATMGAGDDLAAFYADAGPAQKTDPLFLPWLAGERVPVDEERLRGAFYGLSLRHDAGALKRAAIEGVALNTRWVFEKVLAEKGATVDGPVPVVGGAAANPHLVQALADALNRPVRVGDAACSGVRGAAAMAAPALGWAPDVWTAARSFVQGSAPVVDPDPARRGLVEDRYGELKAVRKALVKLYRRRTAT
ncbi:FGGY family carbohydrate kinase [Psychromarinibacter sp. C21-152]|uniref:FGGY family carbohydrate kinase n=1 Tax=Psychromarinibacter sediminicola TaxID=3033385 RepID=A0AAE3NPG9_9RHOB|nr:FGGY family carbohydrate kinase [Psychromarinibacter sediminicola]MDF0600036.1 FGGY family carbohydrate kinase [Psychromarinibacter sediminicola]